MTSKIGSDPTIAISRTQGFLLPLARWTALPLSRYGGSKKRDPIEFGFHDLIRLSLCVVVFEVYYFVGLTKTSRDTKRFTCDPRGIRGSKKDCSRSDVVGLTDATEWCLRFNAFAKIALVETGRAHAFGFDKTGIDGVDANFARTEFLGQRPGDGVDRALRARVN